MPIILATQEGGRDKEDGSSKPAWAIVRPYLRKPFRGKKKNRAGGVAQGEGREFKPQYHRNF
jgi:hypothetical protein